MATTTRDFLRPIRTPAYAFLGVTLCFQISDFLLGAMPFSPGSAMWRFAAASGFANNVGNILLLLTLLYAVSLKFGDRAAMTIVGVFAAIGTLILFGAAASFALDAVQLRGRVAPQNVRKFDVGSAQTLLKFVVQGFVSMILAVSAYRAHYAATRDLQRNNSNEVVFVARPESRTSKSMGAEAPAGAPSAEDK